MADQSFLAPLAILAGIALLVFAPAFGILHLRFRAKRRTQMAEFERLRAGTQ